MSPTARALAQCRGLPRGTRAHRLHRLDVLVELCHVLASLRRERGRGERSASGVGVRVAVRLGCSPGAVSRHLMALWDAGLVEPVDRRDPQQGYRPTAVGVREAAIWSAQ